LPSGSNHITQSLSTQLTESMHKRLVLDPCRPLGIKLGGDRIVTAMAEGQCKDGGIVIGDCVTAVDGVSMVEKTDADVTALIKALRDKNAQSLILELNGSAPVVLETIDEEPSGLELAEKGGKEDATVAEDAEGGEEEDKGGGGGQHVQSGSASDQVVFDTVAPIPLEAEVQCWSGSKWVKKMVSLESGRLYFDKDRPGSGCVCFASKKKSKHLRISSKAICLAPDDIETLPPREIDEELVLALQIDAHSAQSGSNMYVLNVAQLAV
jgi:hypothetical protein